MRVEDIDDVTVLASEASMRGCVMQLTCLSRSAFFQVLQNVFLCTLRSGRGDICECCLYVLVLSCRTSLIVCQGWQAKTERERIFDAGWQEIYSRQRKSESGPTRKSESGCREIQVWKYDWLSSSCAECSNTDTEKITPGRGRRKGCIITNLYLFMKSKSPKFQRVMMMLWRLRPIHCRSQCG